jgi:beta-phosphoglucomutase
MKNALGVIFDMDGVLIDSYQAHFKSWQAMLAEVGLIMTEQEFAKTFGRTSREVLGSLWGPQRFSADEIARLDARKEELFRQIIAADFPAMPGVRELLRSLAKAGFLLGVGTSGPPDNVELTLDRLGMRSVFDAVVTGADVTRGKPDPQVFLTAAARLRLPPEWCVVVEDAPLGVEAAHAADMAAIGLVSTGRTRPALAAAELVVDRLDQLTPDQVEMLIVGRVVDEIADENENETE